MEHPLDSQVECRRGRGLVVRDEDEDHGGGVDLGAGLVVALVMALRVIP